MKKNEIYCCKNGFCNLTEALTIKYASAIKQLSSLSRKLRCTSVHVSVCIQSLERETAHLERSLTIDWGQILISFQPKALKGKKKKAYRRSDLQVNRSCKPLAISTKNLWSSHNSQQFWQKKPPSSGTDFIFQSQWVDGKWKATVTSKQEK